MEEVTDAFGLLTYSGAESGGSVMLLPPGQDEDGHHGTRALSDETLPARIQNLAG